MNGRYLCSIKNSNLKAASDLVVVAREEMAAAEKHIPEMEERIKLLLVPADPEDDKNVIMEIKGAAGGDEQPHRSRWPRG